MEDTQKIADCLLKKGYYQNNNHYYGIYNIDIYKKELELIFSNSYSEYGHSFSFAVFRASIYNWGLGSTLDDDFRRYIVFLQNRDMNELRNAAIFLPQHIKIKSKESSFIDKFEKHIENYTSPFIINSFHYSSYGMILNYLLYHNFEVTCLASQKFIDKYEQRAEACSNVMNRLFCLDSKINFVCANDFDSLVQLGLSVSEFSSSRKKVILLFMDGNVGYHKEQSLDTLVNVNFLGKDIYVRKGIGFLAKILNLPIFNILVDSNEKEGIYIDIIDYADVLKYSVDDFIQCAYSQLEETLSNNNYFKWECWLYIHSWTKKNQQERENYAINKDDIANVDRFTYIRSGKDRYIFDSKYYLSHLISENEKESLAMDNLPLECVLKNILTDSL